MPVDGLLVTRPKLRLYARTVHI